VAPRELIPGAAPLSAVPGLSDAQRRVLANLWLSSAQELVGVYGTTERTRSLLAGMLSISRTELDSVVNSAQRLIPLTRDASSALLELDALRTEYSLGAVLEEPAEGVSTPALYVGKSRHASVPDTVHLLDTLPPTRSQGRRATCVAHAAVAVRECLEIRAGASPDFNLSEQYIYWWCKQRDNLGGRGGTYLSLGMRCLQDAGPPLETEWPYNPEQSASEDQGPPPARVVDGDPAFRVFETQELNRIDNRGIKLCLTEGRPVAFSLPVYDSWFKSSAMKRWGKITMPLSGEAVREGHALTIVGYQDDLDAPGGGYFLVRNSWQPWAWDGVWQPGYGYIPYAYVSRFASYVCSARRETGARPFANPHKAGESEQGLLVNSPDVWLRQTSDHGQTGQPAVTGRENAFYVRLTNPGPTYAYRASAAIYYRLPGQTDWACALEFMAPPLRPGVTVVGPMLWQPPVSGNLSWALRLY
jgi:C1A family cysteine protease